jgi:hypothetical protein
MQIVLTGSLPLHGVNGTVLIDPRTAATSGTGESYLFGTQIPGNAAFASQIFQIILFGQMNSTGTVQIRIRAGTPTATSTVDANILASLTFPSATTTQQWHRYEALVTVSSLTETTLGVVGIGHGWTGTVAVSPVNALAERIITLPRADPWHLSVSASSSSNSSPFRVRHAFIKAL